VARDFLSLACGRENCDKRRRECEAETGTNHPGFRCARIGLSRAPVQISTQLTNKTKS